MICGKAKKVTLSTSKKRRIKIHILAFCFQLANFERTKIDDCLSPSPPTSNNKLQSVYFKLSLAVLPVLPKNWDLTLAFIWHKFPISVPIVAMLISRHPTFNLITLWSLPRKKLLSSAAWMSQDDVKENYFIDALQKGEGEKREGGVAKVYYRMFP